ncbi:prepilin-type N-terminal cleavage/methylation domain-containing protein, partial [bacterium]|nr:prepilin-type N-terminal cleavage/methylation domain-containing protein [bacterium]
MQKGFSLVELLISLVAISCILAAMTPVITKKLSNPNTMQITTANPTELIKSNKKEKDLETFFEILKDCKLNSDKSKLVCEIELSQSDDTQNDTSSHKVTYSARRDKIRFKNREEGSYQTSTVTKKEL